MPPTPHDLEGTYLPVLRAAMTAGEPLRVEVDIENLGKVAVEVEGGVGPWGLAPFFVRVRFPKMGLMRCLHRVGLMLCLILTMKRKGTLYAKRPLPQGGGRRQRGQSRPHRMA